MLDKDNGLYRSLFGCTDRIGQGRGDMLFIETMLSSLRPRSVVEFGTLGGLLSLYLLTASRVLRGSFVTVDIDFGFVWPSIKTQLEGHMYKCDLLAEEPPARIVESIRQPGTLLLCDNGNKRAEVDRYAGLLCGGSVVAVHDFGTEFVESDFRLEGFDHYLWPEAEQVSSSWRAWQRHLQEIE